MYSTLVAYGRHGYVEMIQRQVRFAREVAKWISNSDAFELLPNGVGIDDVFIVTIFRAKDEQVNKNLVRMINDTKKIYVSGTAWESKPEARIAVSNWTVEIERDFSRVRDVLQGLASTS